MSDSLRTLAILLAGCSSALVAAAACSSDDSPGDAFDASPNSSTDAAPGTTADAAPGTTADAAPGTTADAAPSAPDAATVTGCSAEAIELVTLVNEYRDENGLPPIPASPSLCLVGDLHANDLVDNSPDATPTCNLHSWSDQGSWSACCYTADHAQAQCMWDKPSELTDYPSAGYENSAWTSGMMTPTQALNQWKNSSGHNAVILNQNGWSGLTWRALGAGFKNGYAVLWFGTSVDPAN